MRMSAVDVVEETGRDEEAVRLGGNVSLVWRIDEELRTFLDAQLDVTGDLVAVDPGDQRTHLGAGRRCRRRP